ncbi:MAG: DUF4956 domain-containing protein [Planctomycetaceae bacterium]|nr:DUF4956 domain-containing protein [Planctomycetaceae bacterium]
MMLLQNEGIQYFFTDLLFPPDAPETFTWEGITVALIVTTALSYVLCQVYRATYRGTSYTQGYIVSLFFMAIATCVVMMIIGSNIARAFSLVGALSIIRFRTAVKDPRDIAFLFAAMVVGMGCGTGLYPASIILTVYLAILMVILHFSRYGVRRRLDVVARVTYDGKPDTSKKIEDEIKSSIGEFEMINRIVGFGDARSTNVYVLRPGERVDMTAFETRLGAIAGVSELSLYQSDQHATS